MARKVSDTAPNSRPVTRRRRRLPAARRAFSGAPAAVPAQQRTEPVGTESSRPRMTWVLVTDDTGRARPEAIWS